VDGTFSNVVAFDADDMLGVHVTPVYSTTDVKLLIDDVFLLGDYNRNGFVDTPDYVVWSKMLGMAGTGLLADGTGPGGVPDGFVNALDYDFWQARFGNQLGPGGGALRQSVPEPSSFVILILGCVGWTFRRPRESLLT
jgi:hypothetical protein